MAFCSCQERNANLCDKEELKISVSLLVGAPGPKNVRFVHPTPQKRFDSGLLLFDIS